MHTAFTSINAILKAYTHFIFFKSSKFCLLIYFFSIIQNDQYQKEKQIWRNYWWKDNQPTDPGDVIFYQIAKDNRGKYKAINAQIEGVSLTDDKADDLLKTGRLKKTAVVMAIGLIIIIAVAVFLSYK